MKHKWTKEELDYLRKIAPGMPYKEIVKNFNEHFGLNLRYHQIVGQMKAKKIRNGRDMRFHKGHTRNTKDINPEIYKKIKESGTWFKKNQIPTIAVPIGTERTKSDGYTYIKIRNGHGDNNWVLKHRYIYEKEFGPIPEDHVVTFLDSDKSNFDIENLICIDRKIMLRMNNDSKYSEFGEITKANINIEKLKERIREVDKWENI